MVENPVLFLIFNRPQPTQKVFDKIREAKPKTLYIHADGPRKGNKDDEKNCKLARAIIDSQIDWDCHVVKRYRDQNLGCGEGVSSAITWFFEQVEQGIILEDDCVPHTHFFVFCDEMLEKYKHQKEVLSIAGSNFQDGIKRGKSSYYFSIHNRIWGWATWRTIWGKYDFNLTTINKDTFSLILKKYFDTKAERKYWLRAFDRVKNKQIDTWDYQFMFLLWINEGLTVVPNVNLISNIGDGHDATHTNWQDNQCLNRPLEPLNFPLSDPVKIKRNKKADFYYYTHYLGNDPRLFYKIIRKIRKLIKL